MKEFIHRNATTVAQAVSALGEYKGTAAVIAGGTDILGVIKSDIIANYPAALVDLKNIPGLANITETATAVTIGSMATIDTIANNAIVKSSLPMLATAASRVSAQTLRVMGTLGGNLCQRTRCWYFRYPNEMGGRINCFRKGGQLCFAVPGDARYHSILAGQVCFHPFPSDMAIALSALNATIITNSRRVPIDNFYIVLGNTLAPDEIVTGVEVPKPAAGVKQYFYKQAYRRAIDWALVSVASAITVTGGNVSAARITLGAVAPTPYRATGAETYLVGKAISDATATAAANEAVKDAFPLDGGKPPQTSNAYKVQIAKTLVKRAILA